MSLGRHRKESPIRGGRINERTPTSSYDIFPSLPTINVWCVCDIPLDLCSRLSPEHTKDTTRVAAGLKAAIHNPNVSAEAKEHAKEKLKEMGQDVESTDEPQPEESVRVLAGYKATLSSTLLFTPCATWRSHSFFPDPYTSSDAKAHAEEVLQAAGIHERHPEHTDEEHQTRVLAGYKAALHSMS